MEEGTAKSGMSTGAIVGIAVIIALVFGGGAYAIANSKATKEKNDLNAQITELQNQVASGTTAVATTSTTPASATSATADATASWKTYTNSKYSFTIKYPSDWTFKANSTYPDAGFAVYPTFESNYNNPTYSIRIAAGSTAHGMEQYDKQPDQKVTAGGVSWTVNEWVGTNSKDFGNNVGSNAMTASYLGSDGKTEYAVEAYYKTDQESVMKSTFNSMLLSFQFTK